MENTTLLKPTLHVEVVVKSQSAKQVDVQKLRKQLKQWFVDSHVTVRVGQDIIVDGHEQCLSAIESVNVADYTGPPNTLGYYNTEVHQIDLQAYMLKRDSDMDRRRSIGQDAEGDVPQARVVALPSLALKDEWDSLVFEDGLPSRLLRILTRMVSMMRQPGLSLAAFNWNRHVAEPTQYLLCLLHGPPGSGKSTLCRALAQKLSIRLGDAFPKATLIEINTNAMLSKYFGESGKLINATFERIHTAAQDPATLICVVMDEVETIAGSRERSTTGGECNDGMRATNQLLTALDRLRHLPNVIVLCTSNLIGAIDQAFLDRVDIKQLIPSPSIAAIYNIFRSCLNELIRSSLIDVAAAQVTTSTVATRSASVKAAKRAKTPANSSSPEPWAILSAAPEVPTLSKMQVELMDQPSSAGYRIWALAQKCHGLSGRTLRRLPILGLAMYTWGGESIMLDDAVSALEAAVNQELQAGKVKEGDDTKMHEH